MREPIKNIAHNTTIVTKTDEIIFHTFLNVFFINISSPFIIRSQ